MVISVDFSLLAFMIHDYTEDVVEMLDDDLDKESSSCTVAVRN